MPTFLECMFCQRLYSQHSLPIHEKGCLESTEHKLLHQQQQQHQKTSSTPTRGRSKSGKRRKSSAKPIERPRTRSLSRIAIENDALRICFVCGNKFDEDEILRHKQECLEDWSSHAQSLASRFHIHAPKTLDIPSIDGTVDIGRENQKAIQSSQDCQLVRCRGCNARIAIQHADSHQCVRFEPTIEFYF